MNMRGQRNIVVTILGASWIPLTHSPFHHVLSHVSTWQRAFFHGLIAWLVYYLFNSSASSASTGNCSIAIYDTPAFSGCKESRLDSRLQFDKLMIVVCLDMCFVALRLFYSCHLPPFVFQIHGFYRISLWIVLSWFWVGDQYLWQSYCCTWYFEQVVNLLQSLRRLARELAMGGKMHVAWED